MAIKETHIETEKELSNHPKMFINQPILTTVKGRLNLQKFPTNKDLNALAMEYKLNMGFSVNDLLDVYTYNLGSFSCSAATQVAFCTCPVGVVWNIENLSVKVLSGVIASSIDEIGKVKSGSYIAVKRSATPLVLTDIQFGDHTVTLNEGDSLYVDVLTASTGGIVQAATLIREKAFVK